MNCLRPLMKLWILVPYFVIILTCFFYSFSVSADILRCEGSHGDNMRFRVTLTEAGDGELYIRYRDHTASCYLIAHEVNNLESTPSLKLFDIILLRSNICPQAMTSELHHGVKQQILITIPESRERNVGLRLFEGLGNVYCSKFDFKKQELMDLAHFLRYPRPLRVPERGPAKPLF